MKIISVTAAIIENENNEVLICKRAEGSSMGGLWEFPWTNVNKVDSKKRRIIRT